MELLPTISGNMKLKVSEKTVRNWFHELNYVYDTCKKGIFHDGHERDDVVKYRKEFLETMASYLPFMATYEGDEMIEIPPVLPRGTKRIVYVNHDETTCYANDDMKTIWIEKGETILKKKGMGLSLMVSDFYCECHGSMTATINGVEIKGREIIHAGKNRDGWWTNEDLVKQLKKVIQIFEVLHPDCLALFAFDNSQNHNACAPDALVANRIPFGDNVKTPIIRDGWWSDGNIIHQQKMQVRVRKPNGDVVIMPKGINRILTERGLMKKFSLKCTGECTSVECCARSLLSNQPDFKAQKTWLEEIVVEAGHLMILIPKFHCELAFIEMVWCEMKRQARELCDYSFNSLKESIPAILDGMDVKKVRRFARYCFRYMDAYRNGLSGKMADYAVKKYKGHRIIPNPEKISAEFERQKQ